MKKLLSSLIIPAFITACSGGSGNYSGSITPAQPSVVPDKPDSIQVWTPNDKPSEHDLIDGATEECKYVFLQSDTPKSIIGCINQIFVSDSTFTVVDNSVTEKIARFNRNGDYIQTIGSKGKARGEYVGLGCVTKTDDGNLVISDRLSSKLIIYSSDGKAIDEFRMNKQMPHEMIITDSLVLGSFPGYHKSSEFRLKWFNLDGKDVLTAFPFTSTRSYVAGHLLKDGDGKIYYNYDLNDTIFRIDNHRITPEIVMNIHDQELTDKFIKDTETLDEKDYMSKLYSDESIVNQVDLIKCDNKWVVYYQKGSNTYVSVISDNGKSRVNYQRAHVDYKNKKGKVFFPEYFVDYADGYLIGYIDPEGFDYLDDSIRAKYLKRIRQNSVNTPADDEDILNYGNLILCLYKLK